MPYTDYAGNDQYLYQLLCLGAGEFEIEEIRVEDTPITAFAEVETEIIAPGGTVTLFPTRVITSVEVSGQELTGAKIGTYAWAATVITITETAHGRTTGQTVAPEFTSGGATSGVYQIAAVLDADHYTVAHATGAGNGAVVVRSVLGGRDGFVASGADTMARRLALDLVLPMGLFGSGSTLTDKSLSVRFQARQVDDNGAPVGSWIDLGIETMTNRTTTPQRKTFRYTLATPGRYRVRAWRTDIKDTSTSVGHMVLWGGLRSYLAGAQNFGPVTLIAIRMRATDNLSLQATRKIGVIATRKLPVWTGAAWSAPTATTSIAWAIADAARNADYGAGLADAQIDLAALVALDAIWTARGDTFNGRFEQAASWWDAISRLALAGRARMFLQGGVLRLGRDAPASLPVALYSMRNIKRGSFVVDYLTLDDQTADRIDVAYFDATTWSPRRVTAALAGSAGTKPVKIDLFGVTNRDQALREGLYHAAANKYRRRVVKFTTEMEGFIPSIGDLIAIQHDMPGWGASAEALGWDAASRTLTLSEPMVFGPGSHVIGIRSGGGGLSGPWAVTAGADAWHVVLAETPDVTPYTGADRERSHIVFGTASTWRAEARVASLRPRGLHEAELECVIEDPSVHTADQGVTAPPIIISGLPRRVTTPVVARVRAALMPGDATRVLLSWQPAPGADLYQIEMAEGSDPSDPTVSWTRVGDTTSTNYIVTLLYASRSLIRIRGVGLMAGAWAATSIGSLVPNFWFADPTGFWQADANPFWSS